jgi:hypothetical protein
MGNPYVTLIMAANMNDFDARMAEMRNAYMTALIAALRLVAGGAWVVARSALRPVTALAQTAKRVTARTFHVEGVGLGLSSSREIIRAHGGELGIKAGDGNLPQFAVSSHVNA